MTLLNGKEHGDWSFKASTGCCSAGVSRIASECPASIFCTCGAGESESVRIQDVDYSTTACIRFAEKRAGIKQGESWLSQCKADGLLLTDFLTFLHQADRPEDVLSVWALDLAVNGGCHRREKVVAICVDELVKTTKAWEDYQQRPSKSTDVVHLDLPNTAILEKATLTQHKKIVDREHTQYGFSIAAMIGIHVSILCSHLIAHELDDDADRKFKERYPLLDVEQCRRRSIRRFKIPRSGSSYSPTTHLEEDYEIDEICPDFFAQIRQICGLHNEEIFNSLCRTDFEFIDFGTNSKSGEFFFFSHDGQYLIKTATIQEADCFMSMVPFYTKRLRKNQNSLLVRYLGFYRLQFRNSHRLFFVMRAVTHHNDPIHRIFDLKGSTLGRRAKPDECGKDLNFYEELGTLNLPEAVVEEVIGTHREDLQLLRKFNIMDFSVLVEVHYTTEKLGNARLNTVRSGVMLKQSSNISHGVVSKQGSSVVLKQGTNALPWFAKHPKCSHVNKLPFVRTFSGHSTQWSPSGGIYNKDGTMKFTLGIIDILVPFTWYSKSQFLANQVITCCNASQSSRIPPAQYCFRQQMMFAKICREHERKEKLFLSRSSTR